MKKYINLSMAYAIAALVGVYFIENLQNGTVIPA